MADTSAPHVTRATFYRNGDPNFKGKMLVVNPRYYRNFDSFLDTVTWSTQSTNAVTRICTPHGRNYIHNVEKFENGGNYVVLGRERFKRLNYGEERSKNFAARLPPIWRNQKPSSGRYRKVYEGERQALKRIYVYRNGDNMTPSKMILLKRRTLTDMELVLSALQESRINFDFAISKLFTLNGKQIHSCDEIEHDGRYVALERGSRFKPINYEGIPNFSPRSAVNVSHFAKLPPIATRINPSKISYSPRKPAPTLPNKLGPPKQAKPKRTEKKRDEKREQKRAANQPMPPQDSIVSPFEDQHLQRESFSHVSLSITPPPLDESPDFTLSEKIAKGNAPLTETVEKSASPELAIPSDLDKLPDKQKENIGLQLYNASGMQSEWGDMVVENRNTITDKLIDDVPAEEINEEITENTESTSDVEDATETSSGNNQSFEEVITIQPDKEEPKKQEQKEEGNKKEDEIKATASRLVESILQEEENEQSSPVEVPEKPLDRQEASDDEEEVASSQEEDMNSEDEVQSSQEEDDDDEKDDDDEEEEEEDKEKSDDSADEESENEKNKNTETPSEQDESEAELPATKENRTNKKVEEQRADPVAAKKKQIKQGRREKRIDNKA